MIVTPDNQNARKAMSEHTVDFYFDYGSPYSYLGSCMIEKVCAEHGAELRWQPMVIGGLFQSNGTVPIFTLPNKARYMTRDLENLSKFHGIPFKMRTEFLFKPILSLRATLAVPQEAGRGKAVHALYRGAWVDDLDLGQPEVVTSLLDAAGFDGGALVEKTQHDAIKTELRENTERADSMGMFGAPVCVVDGGENWVWGHDRLELVAHYLKTA